MPHESFDLFSTRAVLECFTSSDDDDSGSDQSRFVEVLGFSGKEKGKERGILDQAARLARISGPGGAERKEPLPKARRVLNKMDTLRVLQEGEAVKFGVKKLRGQKASGSNEKQRKLSRKGKISLKSDENKKQQNKNAKETHKSMKKKKV